MERKSGLQMRILYLTFIMQSNIINSITDINGTIAYTYLNSWKGVNFTAKIKYTILGKTVNIIINLSSDFLYKYTIPAINKPKIASISTKLVFIVNAYAN